MTKKYTTPKMKSIGYKFGYYVQASRYEGGMVAAVFLLIGEWCAIKSFPFYSTLLAILAVSGIVNSGSWINYIFDIKLDKFAKKDISFFRYISSKEMFTASFILLLVSSALLFYINILSFLIGLLTFLTFFTYAVPPIRLKILPPFDTILNALGFGTFPFLLGYTLAVNHLPWISLIRSIILGLPVVSYYLFISIFDIQTDKEYGIKTSCTILGFNATIITSASIFILSVLLSLAFFDLVSVIPISLIICLPIVVSIMIFKKIPILRILVSCLFLVWAIAVLLFLSVLSSSIITIAMLIIIIIVCLLVIYTYVKENK